MALRQYTIRFIEGNSKSKYLRDWSYQFFVVESACCLPAAMIWYNHDLRGRSGLLLAGRNDLVQPQSSVLPGYATEPDL